MNQKGSSKGTGWRKRPTVIVPVGGVGIKQFQKEPKFLSGSKPDLTSRVLIVALYSGVCVHKFVCVCNCSRPSIYHRARLVEPSTKQEEEKQQQEKKRKIGLDMDDPTTVVNNGTEKCEQWTAPSVWALPFSRVPWSNALAHYHYLSNRWTWWNCPSARHQPRDSTNWHAQCQPRPTVWPSGKKRDPLHCHGQLEQGRDTGAEREGVGALPSHSSS